MFVIAQRIKSHIETAHSIIRQLEQLPDVNCYIRSNYRCPVISIQFAKWTCPIISTLQILISGLQPVDHVQSSIGSARSYQVVKEIQATLSMYCNRQQKHISTSSNSQIISLVYRMVVIIIERSDMQLTFLDYKATILIKENRCAFAKKFVNIIQIFLKDFQYIYKF